MLYSTCMLGEDELQPAKLHLIFDLLLPRPCLILPAAALRACTITPETRPQGAGKPQPTFFPFERVGVFGWFPNV